MLTVSETGGASEGVTWHCCQGLPEGLPPERTPCQAPGLELTGAQGDWWRPGLSRARAAVRRNQGPGLPRLFLSAPSTPTSDRSFSVPRPRQSRASLVCSLIPF